MTGKMVNFALVVIGSTLFSGQSWALSHYECKGLAPQTIVLTPYDNGTGSVSWLERGSS
jgi:hypothetical protein